MKNKITNTIVEKFTQTRIGSLVNLQDMSICARFNAKKLSTRKLTKHIRLNWKLNRDNFNVCTIIKDGLAIVAFNMENLDNYYKLRQRIDLEIYGK